MKAEELYDLLASQGVPVLGHRERRSGSGGLVWVTENIHVELGGDVGGAVVVKTRGRQEVQHFTRRTTVKDLIYDLVQAGAVVLH